MTTTTIERIKYWKNLVMKFRLSDFPGGYEAIYSHEKRSTQVARQDATGAVFYPYHYIRVFAQIIFKIKRRGYKQLLFLFLHLLIRMRANKLTS